MLKGRIPEFLSKLNSGVALFIDSEFSLYKRDHSCVGSEVERLYFFFKNILSFKLDASQLGHHCYTRRLTVARAVGNLQWSRITYRCNHGCGRLQRLRKLGFK